MEQIGGGEQENAGDQTGGMIGNRDRMSSRDRDDGKGVSMEEEVRRMEEELEKKREKLAVDKENVERWRKKEEEERRRNEKKLELQARMQKELELREKLRKLKEESDRVDRERKELQGQSGSERSRKLGDELVGRNRRVVKEAVGIGGDGCSVGKEDKGLAGTDSVMMVTVDVKKEEAVVEMDLKVAEGQGEGGRERQEEEGIPRGNVVEGKDEGKAGTSKKGGGKRKRKSNNIEVTTTHVAAGTTLNVKWPSLLVQWVGAKDMITVGRAVTWQTGGQRSSSGSDSTSD